MTILLPSAMTAGDGAYVYVSLDSLQTIAMYQIDSTHGGLTFVSGVAVDGQPGSLTVDPTNRFLHAALRTKNSVASFRIDAQSGNLTPIGTTNVGWNPVYLSMDRTGRFLFTVHFADDKAAVYPIGNNGALEKEAVKIVSTPKNPHSIRTNPGNTFLYIPCRSGEAVLQFGFHALDGTLHACVPDRIGTPDSTGPRHMAFHPSFPAVYTANEFGKSVTFFLIDTVRGTLAHQQTLSMLPQKPGILLPVSGSGGADIHITPNGRFLYATNRGNNSIAAYRLETGTGLMTAIDQYPTEKMPRSFAIDPSGKFLYVGGQRSGTIASYRIDTTSGELKQLKTIAVGGNPVWILITDARRAK